MATKEFREIQVSSTLLVVIFLGVLALGVFIFLLGVSVGKKQASVTPSTQIVTQQIPEPVKEAPVKPAASDPAAGGGTSGPAGAGAQPTGSQPAVSTTPPKPEPKEAGVETAAKPPAAKSGTEAKKTPAAAPAANGLYYVQVAAFADKTQAQALADKYKKQGYSTTLSTRATSTKTWYRVRLGGFKTRDQAADLLSKLNAAAGKKTDYQIVRD